MVAVAIVSGCTGHNLPESEAIRAYAQSLLNAQLYTRASAEFDRYLSSPDVSENKKARVQLMLAKTFLESAHDYEEALARFLWLERYVPDFSQMAEVRRGKVEALERLGRSTEAQIALERATDLEERAGGGDYGTVLARVGDRTVTDADIRRTIDSMPEAARREFRSASRRRELVKQLVARELLVDTATRRGYDRKPALARAVSDFRKELLSRRVIEEEMSKEGHISDLDIRTYYEAHKEKYSEGEDGQLPPPIEQIFERVRQDVEMAKRQESIDTFITGLMQTKDVTLFLDRVE